MQLYKENKNHSESYNSETTFAKLPFGMCAHRHALRKAACFLDEEHHATEPLAPVGGDVWLGCGTLGGAPSLEEASCWAGLESL